MLTRDIAAPRAWQRDEIGPRDWIVPLSAACLAELDTVVERVRRDPLPTLLLQPSEFSLSACAWDRQNEHGPGEAKVARRPVFWMDGDRWMACYNERLIHNGATLAGESLDAEGADALAAMDEVVNAPELGVEFIVDRGQVQFISNRHFAHSRTEFADADEPTLKRHLIRLWTRPEGRRAFHA